MSGMDKLQLVAEPRRREILRIVWDRPHSVGEITERLDVSMGAVSQHLAKLRDAGMVTVEPSGRHRLYRADRDALSELAPMLESMWAADLDRLATEAERRQRSTHPTKGRSAQ